MHHFKKILLILIVLSLGLAFWLYSKSKNQNLSRNYKGEAFIELATISSALQAYINDCKAYPTTEEGLAALLTKSRNCEKWGPKPYLKSLPNDPWGHAFIYRSESPSHFILKSLGADGREGGNGDDMDLALEK